MEKYIEDLTKNSKHCSPISKCCDFFLSNRKKRGQPYTKTLETMESIVQLQLSVDLYTFLLNKTANE